MRGANLGNLRRVFRLRELASARTSFHFLGELDRLTARRNDRDMRFYWRILIAVAFASQSGCRVFDRWSRDRERERPSAEPASRGRDWIRDRNRDADSPRPKSYLDAPGVPSSNLRPGKSGISVPAADSGAGQRIISGTVEDPEGRAVENAFVTVEHSDAAQAGHGAPMGVQTDRGGFFSIQGLKANETYILTTLVKAGGRSFGSRQYVKVPNDRIRLQLREDLALSSTRPDGDLPPSGPMIPSGERSPIPPLFDTPGNGGVLPQPSEAGGNGWSPVAPRTAPVRPDLFAPGPQPDHRNSPPVSIPGPTLLPPPSGAGTSRSIARDSGFALLDVAGERRALPSGRVGELVLLDFMTTNCVPCKKAIPSLKAMQDKYRNDSLEIIGVVCNEGDEKQRRDVASRYRREQRLNYDLYVEPSVGRLQDRFDVSSYPTLILIDSAGKILWRGHPKDIDKLERILNDAVASR